MTPVTAGTAGLVGVNGDEYPWKGSVGLTSTAKFPPTNSTLATLAVGDALAVCLIRMRGFGPSDFARFHPGGSLGRRLLGHVKDAMRTVDLPCVTPRHTVGE